jgi:hypothetical protein
MKHRIGWMSDPSLHLIALTTALTGLALALNSHSWWSHRNQVSRHPPGCHACSVCPPEVAAARDAFLIRTGSIQSPDDAE